MTMMPFVFGSASAPKCFDEASPCILEQTAMCVIDIVKDQSKIVPWTICMDTNNDDTSLCNSQIGLSDSVLQECLDGSRSQTLLAQYIQDDSAIGGTPAVHINGKNVDTEYSAIKAALCTAESTLSGCSKVVPNSAGIIEPCMRPDVVV